MGNLVCSTLLDTDVVPFVDNIREDDLRECSVVAGTAHLTVEDQKGKQKALIAKLLLLTKHRPEFTHLSLKTPEGDLVAIGGYCTRGTVWFLCTNLVKQYRVSFLRAIKAIRDEAWQHAAVLTNYMMWSNTTHRGFLEAIGADFSLIDVKAIEGERYVRFYIPRPLGA